MPTVPNPPVGIPRGNPSSPSPMAQPSPAIVRSSSLEADPLKADFKNFLWRAFMTLFGEPPTEIMYEFADWLQHGPNRLIGMGFRGLSKSYITVIYGLYDLHCDREAQVLTLSGSGGGAVGNAVLAYSIVNTFDWLAHLKPGAAQRTSSHAFDVAGASPKKSESFAAESVFSGSVTGRRASLIIPDDVETPNTSETELDRTKLAARFAELGGSVLIPGGRIRVLGTPQTEHTLYKDLADNKGYSLRIWPAEYPGVRPRVSPDGKPLPPEIDLYKGWLAPSIEQAVRANPELEGLPTEPTRFPVSELYDRRKEYGSVEYLRQFKLQFGAGNDARNPLKLRDLVVMEIPGPTQTYALRVPDDVIWAPAPNLAFEDIKVDSLDGDAHVYAPAHVGVFQTPETIRLIVDPSGTGDDETTWAIIAQHLGRLFLVRLQGRLEGFSAATMLAIAQDAKLYGVQKIVIEKNFGGGMFGELLRPALLSIGHPCEIEELNAGSVQKEVRIVDSLQPVISEHRLIIAASVLRQDFTDPAVYSSVPEARQRFYRLTYQLTRITKMRQALAHDDRVDVLASGAAQFMGSLRRALAQAMRDNYETGLAMEVEKLLETRRSQGLSILGSDGRPLPTPKLRLGGLLKAASADMLQSSYYRHRRGQRV